MKKKFSKILGVCLATALLLSLAVVAAPVMVAAPPEADVEASPGGIFTLSDYADGFGTACWSTVQAHPPTTDSVYLDYTTGMGAVYLEFVPEPGVTLADLKSIAAASEWSFWHYMAGGVIATPHLELQFTMPCGYDPANGFGSVDVTIMPLQAIAGTGAWVKQTVLATEKPSWVYYGWDPINGTQFDNDPGSGMGVADLTGIEGLINNSAEMVAHDASASAWELTRIRMEVGWGGAARACYIDDVTIDGTTYDVEHVATDYYYLEPDIAYNVKTAQETFTLIGPCGPVDLTPAGGPDATISWSVEKGCGVPGGGDVATVAGGTTTDNYITIRLNTRGDAHICVVYDEDGAATASDPIELCAEKKWGEIYCTELTKGTLVDDEACVTETVTASFLWDDCEIEIELPADDAVVDWWLMDIGALAAVQALEAELGVDPCDADGGCGGYAPGFFSYDVDGDGTIQADEVFDSAEDAMAAIYAEWDDLSTATNWIAPDDEGSLTYERTTSDTDGITSVTVHLESPTNAILATLTDYPIDKHGENTVCVQHETWVVIPPPTIEKLPNILWAGEKDVIEWRLPKADIGKTVAFYLEDPSVGTFESLAPWVPVTPVGPLPGFAIKDSAWAMVEDAFVEGACGDYGIARVILHSDKQGKSNVIAALYEAAYPPTDQGAAPEAWEPGDMVAQQGFLIYFLAFEEVELVNMGDPTNDEAWEGDGVVSSELGVNDSSLLRLRVKGFFEDPVMKSPRPELPQDVNGDGITDVILPAGRWILPDDYPTMAFGKLLWDLMDTPVDDIVSELDVNPPSQINTLGEFGDEFCWDYAPLGDIVADYPVIGPFSKLEPVNADGTSWDVTLQPNVLADGNLIGAFGFAEDCRTTVVPDGLTTPEDANMPPAEILFVVTDGSGLLTQVNKGNLYQIPDTCLTDTGVVYTNPYYWQEIPASFIIPPMFGSGLAGYEWASWGTNVTIDGPYRFWDGLTVWTADQVNAMNIFGLTTVPTTLKAYSDNRGEAWVDFTQKHFEGSTIQALATFPYLLGDHLTVVSNPVLKLSEDLKDIELYTETIDNIRQGLYVFVRNYDGTPASCELVEWTIDGPYGIFEALLTNTLGACTNDCYDDADFDVDCTLGGISLEGKFAQNCTRLMTSSEIAHFVAEGVFASEAVAEDYAISGLVVLSSHCENVDVPIVIYDCWAGTIIPMHEDKMVMDFCEGEVCDPWIYDVNDDDVISKAEALAAVADYFGGDITKACALEVIALYFA